MTPKKINISKSDDFLSHRYDLKSEVSPTVVREVSQYRREELASKVADFKDGFNKTGLGNAVKVSATVKKASGSISGGGTGWGGEGGTVSMAPEVYSPLWLYSNLNLPRDRAVVNAWNRSFFALNPVVHNAVLLHSTYPISKLNIKCKDPKKKQFFEDMMEEINLMKICTQIAQEYWLLGEAFVYAELDESTRKWSRLLLQNPDYIIVERSGLDTEPTISLRPDENMKRLCSSTKPADATRRSQLDPKIVEIVRKGGNIPLSNFNVSQLARTISPYDTRGTGLPVSIYKQLMLWDRLRESKYVQTQSMINPMTIFKVGNGEHKPTPEELQRWRELIESAEYNKDFKIITHDAFAVEVVGKGSATQDINPDITQLLKEIYIGLLVPQVFFEGGDITYSNGSIQLDVLKQRYMQFRSDLATWIRTKIFAPISRINEFYDYENSESGEGQKKLVVPEIEWNHMSMFDMADYVASLTQLLQGEVPKVSLHTVYRSLGLDYDEEQAKIREESIDSIIRQKEMTALNSMRLSELRTISESGGEINEKVSAPLPGMEEDEAPAQEGGGGGGGLGGLGGLGEGATI